VFGAVSRVLDGREEGGNEMRLMIAGFVGLILAGVVWSVLNRPPDGVLLLGIFALAMGVWLLVEVEE
jgi:hypothetical protein